MDWLKADYWYLCEKHKVQYPRGAKCPRCEKEEKEKKMARARLHMICGNCGCNDMFTYTIDPEGHDYGDHFEPAVFITCENCSTIHDLETSKSTYKYMKAKDKE